jgi:hypothetical protein
MVSIIVSIPVELGDDAQLAELEENGVKGRYVSVERLTILENGKIEWRMATSSTPGGNIPLFVSERTMASKISDVSSACCKVSSISHHPSIIGRSIVPQVPADAQDKVSHRPAIALIKIGLLHRLFDGILIIHSCTTNVH